MSRTGLWARIAPVGVLLLFILPHIAQALRTSDSFTKTRILSVKQKHFTESRFLDYYKSKFAFAAAGVFKGTISINADATADGKQLEVNQTRFASSYKIVFCDVTDYVVRDSSYQMKRVFLLDSPDWKDLTAGKVCANRKVDRLKCESHTLKPITNLVKTFNDRRNRIYLITLVGCVNRMRVSLSSVTPAVTPSVTNRISYRISMLNPDARFPQLGWEEAAYPYGASVITGLALAVFATVIIASAISHIRSHDIHFVLKVLLCTSAVKIVSSSLTAVAFWRASITGKFMTWFFVLRVPLIILDEILIGLLMLVMSTGIGMMPTTWMFDRRSSTFAVFLGLALELFTVVTSEVVFAYRYLGLIVFLISGGTVACIGILFSWKNTRFIAKYTKLVRLANIYVETTPLLRMRLFFSINAVLVLTLWLFKIVTFGVMDHVLYRPDLLWTCFEAADVTLLIWYAISAFPRQKSAFYVDMTNVDNVRLREVNAWRVRQEQQRREERQRRVEQPLSANIDESNAVGTEPNANGTTVEGTLALDEAWDLRQSTSVDSGRHVDTLEDDPEPEWISWESGMTLPVPTTGMWSVNYDVRRVLRRQRQPECPETMVRVLGSRMDSPDSLSLTIAKPIIGPDAPKRSGRGISGSPEALMSDRDDPIGAEDGNSSMGLRMRQSVPRERIVGDEESGMEILPLDGDGDRDSATRSRRAAEYTDSEMFSVPSSNASADGEIFTEHSGIGRRRL